MKIISIASQKGGAGKSTIAINLCAALAIQGKPPLLIDADHEQPTSSEWAAGRSLSNPDASKITFRQESGEIDELLDNIRDTHDYIIVDSAGHASVEMRSSFVSADIILTPFKCSQADLNTLDYMSGVVRRAKEINRRLIAYAFINAAPTNAQADDIRQAREFIGQYPDFTLLDTTIYHRKCYVESMSEGLGVVEMPLTTPSNTKAAMEILSLCAEVCHGN